MGNDTLSSALNKIADVIVAALGILDYSYIISGVTSYLVITFTLKQMCLFCFCGHGKAFYLVALFLSYILGLISWVIGRSVRNTSSKGNEFQKIYDETIGNLKCDKTIFEISKIKSDSYILMWKSLYPAKKDSENDFHYAIEDLKRIRRDWVMQAVFEGLLGTCIICLLCITFYLSYITLKREVDAIIILIVLFMYSIVILLMLLFADEAKRYAENQIKEIITSYYKYHKN